MRIYSIRSFHLLLFSILLTSFFSVNSDSTAYTKQVESNNNILIISSKEEKPIIDSLLETRNKINENTTHTFIDVADTPKLINLAFDYTLSSSYTEFWFITNKLANFDLVSELISQVYVEEIPGLIVTSNINLIPENILYNLGIVSCEPNLKILYENQLTKFVLRDPENFSSLIKNNASDIKAFNGTVESSICELSETSYVIMDIIISHDENQTTIPALFQPFYSSKLLIAPFMIRNITDFSIINSNLYLNFLTKIQQFVPLDIFSIFSVTSYLNINGWQPFSFDNILNPQITQSGITGSVSVSDSVSAGFSNLIDENFQLNLLLGSLFIGILTFLFFFLRKYGIYVVGFLISILALLKIPSRKISAMEVYQNNTRKGVLDILSQKKGQGETIRNLSKRLSIPLQTLLWHVQILEDFDLISKEKVKRETVLVSIEYLDDYDSFGKLLKEFELTFKTEKAKKIYDYLLSLKKNDEFNLKKLINRTNYTQRTINRYIIKLLALEIIIVSGKLNTKKLNYRLSPKLFNQLKELY